MSHQSLPFSLHLIHATADILSSITGPTVEVTVGKDNEDRQHFAVHKDVLQSSSEYLRTALKKEWQEGEIRKVDLHDVEQELFHSYVKWLYTGAIYVKPTNYQRLAECYCLGERLLDRKYQNCLIDAIVACSRQVNAKGEKSFPMKSAGIIYEWTPKGSPARNLMIDFFVRYGWGTWMDVVANWEVSNEAVRIEFVMDLLRALMDNRAISPVRLKHYAELDSGRSKSYYHETTAHTPEMTDITPKAPSSTSK